MDVKEDSDQNLGLKNKNGGLKNKNGGLIEKKGGFLPVGQFLL